ncbi:hypothetical protein DU000_10075 [Parvibium lacunae]|uniref:Uncharacterized protein n=1 Tax=Parvibium lacunae TaxID=1888893 RepID=A0A368L0R8_9BURK|nr:hypothetical protein DU000_10075 [Parvibium lacunae]
MRKANMSTLITLLFDRSICAFVQAPEHSLPPSLSFGSGVDAAIFLFIRRDRGAISVQCHP